MNPIDAVRDTLDYDYKVREKMKEYIVFRINTDFMIRGPWHESARIGIIFIHYFLIFFV